MKEMKIPFLDWLDKNDIFYDFINKLTCKLLVRNKTSIKILNWIYKHVSFKIHFLISIFFLVYIIYSFFISKSALSLFIMVFTALLFGFFYLNFLEFVADEIEKKIKNYGGNGQ